MADLADDWLPGLVEFNDYGNWDDFLEAIYGYFFNDFVRSKPRWPGKRFALKRYPEYDGKSATFWHMISEGRVEDERTPDFRRCERIRWPRPIIDEFPNCCPTDADRVLWWENRRGSETRVLLAIPDFSYLVVMADRGDFIMPWTAYPVERTHQRQKLERDYNTYWQNRPSGNG